MISLPQVLIQWCSFWFSALCGQGLLGLLKFLISFLFYMALGTSHHILLWPSHKAAMLPLPLVRKPKAAWVFSGHEPLYWWPFHMDFCQGKSSHPTKLAFQSPTFGTVGFFCLSSERLKMLTREGPKFKLCNTWWEDPYQVTILLVHFLS